MASHFAAPSYVMEDYYQISLWTPLPYTKQIQNFQASKVTIKNSYSQGSSHKHLKIWLC